MYFEPKEEVIILQMNSALLAGSIDETGGEADLNPTEGGQDDFPNQE